MVQSSPSRPCIRTLQSNTHSDTIAASLRRDLRSDELPLPGTPRRKNNIFNRHKIFRPTVVSDYVERGELERRLSEPGACPIQVVVAPAGYGKSSLVSHWIEQTSHPCVWVSLDQHDSDPRVFFSTLAAALKDACPAAAENLEKFCDAQELPPPEAFADILSGDIDALDGPLAIVLDDYHTIESTQVHQFVDALLPRRPQNFQIVLVSRRTPPLTLGRLRSQGLVADVRLRDLQFDKEVQRTLVAAVTDISLSESQLDKLHSMTEGWPAGLRLFLLARPSDRSLETYLDSIDGTLWQIQDYLTEEVLSGLPEEISEIVIRTSILQRVSPELCDALLDDDDIGSSGQDAVNAVSEYNLFCVPLSQSGQWFRYHHQFQDLLLERLKVQKSAEEIQLLHRRVAAWYDHNNYPEDAIHHYLQANDEPGAGEVIARHGAEFKESQQWTRLDQVLAMVPKETIEGSVDLSLLLAWASDKAGRVAQMIDLIKHADALLRQQETTDTRYSTRLAQIRAIRSTIELHLGKSQDALESARQAVNELPQEFLFDRSTAKFIEAYALQTLGLGAKGVSLLWSALEGDSSKSYRARILFGMCFLDWASGDLAALSRNSKSLSDLGSGGNFQETFQWATWYSGAALYLQNDLDAAESLVQDVCENRWPIHFVSYAYCLHIQTLVYAARGEIDTAQKLASALAEKCLSARSSLYMSDVQALEAELAFKAGDIASATTWALSETFDSPFLGWGFVSPGLKATRILIKSDSAANLKKADDLLCLHEKFYETTHNARFLVETLALRALYSSEMGDENAALTSLSRAIELSQPGGMVRVFIDLGPDIVPLLNRLEASGETLTFVGKILSAFNWGHAAVLPETLSKREREVLTLLADRMSNKEIGQQLFISPATVKRHTHNIYEKLNVSDRHEAVAKASGLGLLP